MQILNLAYNKSRIEQRVHALIYKFAERELYIDGRGCKCTPKIDLVKFYHIHHYTKFLCTYKTNASSQFCSNFASDCINVQCIETAKRLQPAPG